MNKMIEKMRPVRGVDGYTQIVFKELDNIAAVAYTREFGGRHVLRTYTRNSRKPQMNYYYTSKKQMLERLNNWVTNLKTNEEEKRQRRKARSAGTEGIVNIGDIMYTSWGYNQTNVEFFEVVGLTKTSVKLREIAQSRVGSDQVKPEPGNYIGETITKRFNALYRSAKISSCRTAWILEDPNSTKYSTPWGMGH